MNENLFENYLNKLPNDQKETISRLIKLMEEKLPRGFEKNFSYGMPGYVVPLSSFPQGYLNNPNNPIPFINIAPNKHYVSLYHMGLYNNQKLNQWFIDAYAKLQIGKLDMGKSCIRLKNSSNIPYSLFGELFSKITPEDFIKQYEQSKGK